METEPLRRERLLTYRLAGVLAAASLAWAAAIGVTGGIDLTFSGIRVRSTDPLRPLLAAWLALAGHLIAGGPAARARWLAYALRVNGKPLVAALACVTFVAGLVYSTTAAAGSDAYGYVSQSDLWLAGNLRIQQPWVEALPWPDAAWTASPLGYRPASHTGPTVIVPTYSPGLPLLMAGAKALAGHCAIFLVVPLCGALVVVASYGVASRLNLPAAGLASAWLTATSPPFLYTLILPWSDVPATAAWTTSAYFLLGSSRVHAAAAGLASAAAILIRPNLAWAVLVFASWFVIRPSRPGCTLAQRLRDGGAYAAASGLGILAVALVYQHLFGSPFESGYGRFSDNFDLARVPGNALRYVNWLIETRAYGVIVGTAGLAALPSAFWPKVFGPRVRALSACFVAGVFVMYAAYFPFEGWSNLRFLLPAYPLATLAAGALAVAVVANRGAGASLAMIGLVVAIGVFLQFGVAFKGGTFGLTRTERRYPAAAELTRRTVEPASVVFAMRHSGSCRYYGGLVTIRYDLLDPDWLDRAVEWLNERGVRAYLLVDEDELDPFRQRFASQRVVRRIEGAPVLRQQGGGTVRLYALSHDRSSLGDVNADAGAERCVQPRHEPALQLTR